MSPPCHCRHCAIRTRRIAEASRPDSFPAQMSGGAAVRHACWPKLSGGSPPSRPLRLAPTLFSSNDGFAFTQCDRRIFACLSTRMYSKVLRRCDYSLDGRSHKANFRQAETLNTFSLTAGISRGLSPAPLHYFTIVSLLFSVFKKSTISSRERRFDGSLPSTHHLSHFRPGRVTSLSTTALQ